MKYLWTEDTGAGFHFWQLVNRIFFDGELIVEYLILAGFKRFSTERVMKSLAGELTENEKWSIKGELMGECWYKDCCVSEHKTHLRCGEPEVEGGKQKMMELILSGSVQKVLKKCVCWYSWIFLCEKIFWIYLGENKW